MKYAQLPRLWLPVAVACLSVYSAGAQADVADSTGVPGDHFSLHGALEMFRLSSSVEDFEQRINREANHVNNLDLNGDGETDYVRVVSKMEGDVHVFILQVPVSESESQDVAVIELEKTAESTANIQIVGDEDIFGEQTIVEPQETDAKSVPAPVEGMKGGGPLDSEWASAVVVVNVWPWPCVRFVYAPGYRPWVSPWRWRHYPGWWRPWRPLAWRAWHPLRRPYVVAGFGFAPVHRVVRAHRVYVPVRTHSAVVRTRHSASIGHYRVTRTKTIKTTTGPRGNTIKTTKTKTRVRRK